MRSAYIFRAALFEALHDDTALVRRRAVDALVAVLPPSDAATVLVEVLATDRSAARDLAEEKIYDLDVMVIPTHQPVRRVDYDDLVYKTKREKYNAVIDEIEEAATIDGANSWHMLWYITWPLLRPVTFIVLIFAINSAFQGFDLPLLMTKGGPANHTQVVGLRIFSFGFGDDLQLGIASAMGWVLFLLVFVLSLINLRLFRPATGEVTE